MGNPFRRPDKEEIQKREADKRTIETKVKALTDSARTILSLPNSVRYIEQLEMERDNIIKLAIRINEPDPIKFAFFCKAVFSKLGVLYGLLESIERDARAR